MRPCFVLLILAGMACGLVGCGPSDQPRKDAEGKAAKAPEVPPSGV